MAFSAAQAATAGTASTTSTPPTSAPPAPTTTTAAPRPTTTHTHAPSTTTTAEAAAATTTTHTHAPTTTTTARPAPTTTTTAPPPPAFANAQEGAASWYQAASAGNCAHRTIPKGTRVKVTNRATGASVTCLVSDRGPYIDGRIIDLAEADFERLAGSHEGVIQVLVQW